MDIGLDLNNCVIKRLISGQVENCCRERHLIDKLDVNLM